MVLIECRLWSATSLHNLSLVFTFFVYRVNIRHVMETSELTLQRTKNSRASKSTDSSENLAPSIYDFTDYREFLKSFFEFKKLTNPAYSASMFARKAGLGSNSRGYLKLVIENKRNLSAQTIRSFSDALGFTAHESLYFENLVLFNQSDRGQDKKYYFDRLVASNRGNKPEQLELMKAGILYHSNWYYFAVREMVALKGFKEDNAWISQQLRGKVKKDEVAQAVRDLLSLGLLTRDPEGNLKQSEPLVKVSGGFYNPYIQKFHLEMLDRSKEAILEDDYEDRHASGVTLSCSIEHLPEIKRAISQFRDQITERFGVEDLPPDSVLQMSIQLFQLTLPKKSKETSK